MLSLPIRRDRKEGHNLTRLNNYILSSLLCHLSSLCKDMYFDNIIGQDLVIKVFSNILDAERLSHAYIFSGPAGIGKFLFARTLAKVLLCQNDKPGNWIKKGCDKCSSCKSIEKNSQPNLKIVEVDKGKQEISISAVRQIQEELGMMPFYKSHRVFIINEAENLSEEASNALLKTLEEPVPNTILILVTSNLASLIPTVQSRCQVIRFLPIRHELLRDYLMKNLKIKKEQADFLAHFSSGSIGDAIKLFSQGLLERREDLISDIVADKADTGNNIVKYAKANSDDSEGTRLEVRWQLKIIGIFINDVLTLSYGQNEDALLNQDKISEIRKYQKCHSIEDIERFIKKLLESERYINYNVNVNIVMDNLFVA